MNLITEIYCCRVRVVQNCNEGSAFESRIKNEMIKRIVVPDLTVTHERVFYENAFL